MNKCKAIVLVGVFILGLVLGSCGTRNGMIYGRTENGKFRRV